MYVTKQWKCKAGPTFIDLNPVKLKHYQFMISLNKCNGNRNSTVKKSCKDLSAKISAPNKTRSLYKC